MQGLVRCNPEWLKGIILEVPLFWELAQLKHIFVKWLLRLIPYLKIRVTCSTLSRTSKITPPIRNCLGYTSSVCQTEIWIQKLTSLEPPCIGMDPEPGFFRAFHDLLLQRAGTFAAARGGWACLASQLMLTKRKFHPQLNPPASISIWCTHCLPSWCCSCFGGRTCRWWPRRRPRWRSAWGRCSPPPPPRRSTHRGPAGSPPESGDFSEKYLRPVLRIILALHTSLIFIGSGSGSKCGGRV